MGEKSILNVIKAIFIFILGFVILYASYTLIILLCSVIAYFLSKIPIINTFVGWFFKSRGDTPFMAGSFLAAILSHFLTKSTIKRLGKGFVGKLSCSILGVFVVILNILFFVINISNGDNVLANVLLFFVGMALLFDR